MMGANGPPRTAERNEVSNLEGPTYYYCYYYCYYIL